MPVVSDDGAGRWRTVGRRGPHVVVAATLIRGQEVLLCRRCSDRVWFPGVWDLPGGHVDPGERPLAALTRELDEELGVDLSSSGLPDEPHLRLRTEEFDLSVWRVVAWVGEPRNRAPAEHDAIGWFDADAAERLPLAAAAYPVLLRRLLGDIG